MHDPDIPVPGVSPLEHTADVGLEIVGSDLPDLFHRAARGAMWLVLEREGEGERFQTRSLELAEPDLASLLRAWLRALLLWQEMEGFVVEDASLTFAPSPACESPDGLVMGLRARVVGVLDSGPSVREIKGVTLHGLAVEQTDSGWWGRVLFDV